MMLRVLCLWCQLALSFAAVAQWMLDDQWGGAGRRIGASDLWEIPVALDHDLTRVHMLSAAYDSTGTTAARWRAFSTNNGTEVWSGSGFEGETPVDLRTSFSGDRWFLFTEAPVGPDSSFSKVWRIRSFQEETEDTTWGDAGVVDLGFVGPWHEGGGMDMVGPADESSKADLVGPWMVVAGAALETQSAVNFSLG